MKKAYILTVMLTCLMMLQVFEVYAAPTLVNLALAEADFSTYSDADLERFIRTRNTGFDDPGVRNTAPGGLVLTTSTGQASSIFYSEQFNRVQGENAGFSTYFTMNIFKANTSNPADGFVFVLAKNQSSLGSLGGGLGYQNIAESLGIEFDFYQNGLENDVPHTDVFINGVHNSNPGSGTLFNDASTFRNKFANASTGAYVETYHIWIELKDDGNTNRLEIRVHTQDNRPSQALLIRENLDLSAIEDYYFIGITAATGGLSAEFVLGSWYFANQFIEGGIQPNLQTFTVDNQGPTAPQITQNEAGQLVLSGSEDISGINGYQYRFADVDVWVNYTTPLVLNRKGTLQARAIDNVGNIGELSDADIVEISFTSNHAVFSLASIYSLSGTSLEAPDLPLNNEYVFNRWAFSNDLNDDFIWPVTISSDLEISFFHWQKIPWNPPLETSFVFNQNVQNPKVNDSPYYTLSQPQVSQVGIYQSTVNLVDSTRYLWWNNITDEAFENPITFSWEILKADYPMTEVTWDYDGPYVFSGDLYRFSLSNLPHGITPVFIQHEATQAGIYQASVSFEYDTINFNTPTVESITWEILKATYDMSNVSWDYVGPFIYTGNVHTVLLTGLPQGVTPEYQSNLALNAGRYRASVVFTYDNANYETPTFDSLAWEVTQAEYNLSQVTWNTETFIFNGTIQQVYLTNLPSGITALYQNAQASEAGIYTASVTFDYDVRNFFTPSIDDHAWTIEKAHFNLDDVVWVQTSTDVFDGTLKTIELYHLPEGLTASISGNHASQVGIYTASVTFDYDDRNFHSPTIPDYEWAILKATFDLSQTSWDYQGPFVFNGDVHTVTLTSVPEGLIPTYLNNTQSQAGTYEATVTFTFDENNYERPLFTSVVWEILPAYTVAFVSAQNTQTERYFAGETIDYKAPPSQWGYRFIGYRLEDGSAVPTTMPARDIRVIATYQPLEASFTYWTAELHESFTLITDQLSPALPQLSVPEGWVFVGYFSAPLAFGSQIVDTTLIQHAHHHTPYPYWFDSRQAQRPRATLSLEGVYRPLAYTMPANEAPDVSIPWMNVTIATVLFGAVGWMAWKGKPHG